MSFVNFAENDVENLEFSVNEPNNIKLLFEKAVVEEYYCNNYCQASLILKQILTFNPVHFNSFMLLGLIFEKRNIYDKAFKAFSLAQRVSKKDTDQYFDASYKIAWTLKNQKKFADSIELCKDLLLFEESNFRYLHLLTLNYLKFENFSDSLAWGVKALNVASTNHEKHLIHYLLGGINFNLSDSQKALDCFDETISFQPLYYPAYTHKAICLLTLGENALALKAINASIQISQEMNADALIIKGHILTAMSAFEEALSFFKKALRIKPNSEDALFGKDEILDILGLSE